MHLDAPEQKQNSRVIREEDVKVLLAEAEHFKRLAFWGVLVCTVATLTASICVPMLYSYAQYVQSSLRDELGFCAHRTRNLFNEFDKVKQQRIKETINL